MKKIFYVMALFITACAFTACGNKTSQGVVNDSDTVAVDTVDTVSADTTVAVDSVK